MMELVAKKIDWERELEIPKMDVWSQLKHFGPGILLMMTGVGTSHLVMAPTAGGRFAYALLWCIPVAYIFKYYGFEMAFRYTNATGKSILDAYATAKGKWPVWYVFITTLIQCAVGQAGRLIAASAVCYFFFTVYLGAPLATWIYGLLLAGLSVGLLLTGKYKILELVTKILAGILMVSAIAVFAVTPPPLEGLAHLFIYDTPYGSWLIIAAWLGLLPTGIDVSLQASEWTYVKGRGLTRVRRLADKAGLARSTAGTSNMEDFKFDISTLPSHAREYIRKWYRTAIWDFRVGHIVSALTVIIFVCLAAVTMYPSAVEGTNVMGEIAKIYTLSVGPWMMGIFLAGAFAALFSTSFNYFDGWPRVCAACCRNLFKRTANLSGYSKEELTPEVRRRWYSEYNIWRIIMVYSLIAAVIIIAGVPKPVYVVLVGGALAYFIAPVIYFLNFYYCIKGIPKGDKQFYPSRGVQIFTIISFVVFTVFAIMCIAGKIFKIPIIGA